MVVVIELIIKNVFINKYNFVILFSIMSLNERVLWFEIVYWEYKYIDKWLFLVLICIGVGGEVVVIFEFVVSFCFIFIL